MFVLKLVPGVTPVDPAAPGFAPLADVDVAPIADTEAEPPPGGPMPVEGNIAGTAAGEPVTPAVAAGPACNPEAPAAATELAGLDITAGESHCSVGW